MKSSKERKEKKKTLWPHTIELTDRWSDLQSQWLGSSAGRDGVEEEMLMEAPKNVVI